MCVCVCLSLSLSLHRFCNSPLQDIKYEIHQFWLVFSLPFFLCLSVSVGKKISSLQQSTIAACWRLIKKTRNRYFCTALKAELIKSNQKKFNSGQESARRSKTNTPTSVQTCKHENFKLRKTNPFPFLSLFVSLSLSPSLSLVHVNFYNNCYPQIHFFHDPTTLKKKLKIFSTLQGSMLSPRWSKSDKVIKIIDMQLGFCCWPCLLPRPLRILLCLDSY